jgi:RNA chaperone Hfq
MRCAVRPASDRARKKQRLLQDVFLSRVREAEVQVTMFLVNGVMLQGRIAAYDLFCMLLEREGFVQLAYKHAVSTIQPASPVDLTGDDDDGDDEGRGETTELRSERHRRRGDPRRAGARRVPDIRGARAGSRAARLGGGQGAGAGDRAGRGRRSASCRSAKMRPNTLFGEGQVENIAAPASWTRPSW